MKTTAIVFATLLAASSVAVAQNALTPQQQATQRAQQQAAQRAYQASAQSYNEVVKDGRKVAAQTATVAVNTGKGMVGGAIATAVTGNPAAVFVGTATGAVNGIVDAGKK